MTASPAGHGQVLALPFGGLGEALRGTALEMHAEALRAAAGRALAETRHGDLPRWLAALSGLPRVQPLVDLRRAAPRLGMPAADTDDLARRLMELHPWRKGPLELGGVAIDSEWRSDWKWERVAPHLALHGETVLDVGSGNGYFGWRMLGAGARCVIGVDPTLVYVMQWLAQTHFAGASPEQTRNFVLPLRDRDLPQGVTGFDTVFSMGVIYHRRNPAKHLARLRNWLRSGGRLVLETLVLDEPGDAVLTPADRYARMRNVHYIPTPKRLETDLAAAGFVDLACLDRSATTMEEQRTTPWMRFESLAQCLAPGDPSRTIEGHPAPVRAVFIGRSP